jgi:hypothetical protein
MNMESATNPCLILGSLVEADEQIQLGCEMQYKDKP